jgi:hypothetical protein
VSGRYLSRSVPELNPIKSLSYIADTKGNRRGYSHIEVITPTSGKTIQEYAETGKERYDTYLIRNIEWCVHLQRCMRLLMKEYLEWVDDPVVTKSYTLAKSITEYKNDIVFDPYDF